MNPLLKAVIILGMTLYIYNILSNLNTIYHQNYYNNKNITQLISEQNDILFQLFSDGRHNAFCIWLIEMSCSLLGIIIACGVLLDASVERSTHMMGVEIFLLISKCVCHCATFIVESNPVRTRCLKPESRLYMDIFYINYDQCGDMMFSGHTFQFLIVLYYMRDMLNYAKTQSINKSINRCIGIYISIIQKIYIIMPIWFFLFICGLIYTRYHYSVDIFLSILLTTFAWESNNLKYIWQRFIH